MAAGIPISAAAPTAPATGGAGGRGSKRGSAPLAAATLPRTATRSASPAARQGAQSIAGAMPPAAQAGPPFYTVIELESGLDHGTYDTEAEVAACLAFAGLRIGQVEIVSNVPLMAPSLTGTP